MGQKNWLLYITGAWLKIHDLRALMTNTPYIAFTALFSLINNHCKYRIHAIEKTTEDFPSLHDTNFKCTIV